MQLQPTDHVLHLSFEDEAFARADVFCGAFNKRQVANKTFKPIDFSTTKLPFKDKTFDLGYASNILSYSHQPELLLGEIKRVGHKAHIKERSEFAEMIFGWDNTRWIIDVENRQLVIKSKNALKIGQFGPFFHGLYATDPVFFDYCSQHPGLFSVAVDWDENDDIIEEIEQEVEEFVLPDAPKNEIFEEIDLDKKDNEKKEKITMAQMKKVKKKIQIRKSVFRPCQTEYFDDVHIVLGDISDKIDVRHLKNKNLV